MTLAELLNRIGLRPDPFDDREITALVHNSAQAAPGALFLCIRGARANGHRYAFDAYRRGCRCFVAEEPLDLPGDAAVFTVPDTHSTLGLLASAFYGDPSRDLTVIGITGTKGKTTVSWMLASILNRSGIPCGYIGTNGIRYGTVTQKTDNSTPDALILQRTLAGMRQAGCTAAVLEVSSQALLLDRVAGISFRAAIFTNFSEDHIGPGEHPTPENYFACKHRLFTDFGIGTAICNADDPSSPAMMAGTTATRVVTCGSDAGVDYRTLEIHPTGTDHRPGVALTFVSDGRRVPCRLPLIGTVNASNALLAIACAKEVFGVSPVRSADLLCGITVPGRSEILHLANGAIAVIDYAHNKASLRQLLEALRACRPERLICLFGSVGDRTSLRRAELGAVAAELADLCILTSDNPGNEPPEQIIADIAASFRGSETPFLCIPDRAEAIRRAVAMLRPGDILALAGKGHETYQLIGNEKVPFSEREILLSASDGLTPRV